MSGICLAWRKAKPQRIENLLASMCSGLSCEGEEQSLQECDHDLGIGIAARFATQQLYRNDRIILACDADCYNEREWDEWIGAGAVQAPAKNGIAARVAALYERFGVEFVDKLRGGFSIVLWDKREQQAFAAIDGFGIKRLVYYETADIVLIASRIDALLRAGVADFEVNARMIPNLLNFSVNLGPETAFTDVRRVSPGTILTARRNGQARTTRYWDMRYAMGGDSNEERLSRELESIVERSVSAHCKEDPAGSIGAFLSGGTDSSTITGLLRRRNDNAPVKAFSIGFQEEQFNELEYAEIAARTFKAQHYTYLVGPDDCLAALPRMISAFDEPFGNSSAIPTYFCARLAAQNGVKVLLAGDGGDELFAGNEWYATDRIFQAYHSVPRFLRTGAIEPVLRVLPDAGIIGRARNYVRRAQMAPVDRILSFQFLYMHPPAEVFHRDFLSVLNGYSVGEIPSQHYSQAAARDHLDRTLYMDMKITIADSDLPKVTLMSELAGIQPRFPFLDRSVAEFTGRIPARLKVKGMQKRYLFKRAFRELLPQEIMTKKKHGFGIPVSKWLRSHPRTRELMRDTLFSTRANQRGYFQRQFVEQLVRKHNDEDSTYYGDTLWTLLALELWHLQYVDRAVSVAV